MPNQKYLCPHCKGKRFVPLRENLQRTVEAVAKLGQATGHDVFTELKEDVHPSAIDKRLARLVDKGLLKVLKKPRMVECEGFGVRGMRVYSAS